MRVVMPILEYHPVVGGAQRQLAALGPLLAARGVEGHVLTRAVPGRPERETLHALEVHRLRTGTSDRLAGPRYVAAADRAIRMLAPDVVHAFSLFSPTLIAVRARRRLGLPTIVKVLRGGEEGERARILHKPFAASRIARMRRFVDRFAVISHEIDEDLEALGVPVEKRTWLPNGVDVERFRPAGGEERRALRTRLGFGEGPVAVYCGRFAPEKDLDSLVELWPELRRRHPGSELVLVGDGSESQRIEALAGEGVRLVGTQTDVAPWLQAADLFVLPSRTEGLSNAMLEAMSVGLPVVITRVGGAADVVEDDRSGLLVEPGSADALEAALSACLAEPERRLRLGQGARKTILDGYSLEHTADRWVEEYRGLIERARAERAGQ